MLLLRPLRTDPEQSEAISMSEEMLRAGLAHWLRNGVVQRLRDGVVQRLRLGVLEQLNLNSFGTVSSRAFTVFLV